jgi:hypothetical protein
LGFIINMDKSNLIPSQEPVFLGARLDLVQGRVFPSEKRAVMESAQAHVWLRVLGLIASMVGRLGSILSPSYENDTNVFPSCLPSTDPSDELQRSNDSSSPFRTDMVEPLRERHEGWYFQPRVHRSPSQRTPRYLDGVVTSQTTPPREFCPEWRPRTTSICWSCGRFGIP